MNSINFQQTGGFPLETNTLNFMQSAYKLLQNSTAIAGDNFILSGCVVNGSNISDGFVVINGEVLPFVGGLFQTTVAIIEDKQTAAFENGQVKDVFFTRYATPGTGTGAIEMATILRIKKLSEFRNLPTVTSSQIDLDDENVLATAKAVKLLNDKIDTQFPPGCILIWSGIVSNIPVGFALCDGQEGRPDLRDKFVFGGGGAKVIGIPGGSETKRILLENLPAHDHPTVVPSDGVDFGSGSTRESVTGKYNGRTGPAGGGVPLNIMPPFLTLAYIIKL